MKKKKKTIITTMTIICLVGSIVTLILMLNWNNDVKENNQIQQNLEKYLETANEDKINIDFEELKKINKDTVGYIEVPNTNVRYVVVKGEDNSYYLNHNFNKEKNIAGWIFMDYKNKADGTDKNLVIYGHETKDGSMFGSLSNLLSEDFIKKKENLIITFVTERGIKKYQIFSIYTIEPEDYYITVDLDDNEFNKFKEKIKKRSLFKLEANLENKNIITLSTCQNHGTKRLAVHGVEI